MADLLFAPEVAFSSLNRSVPEKELNLLQFAACQMAQSGTCAPQVMRGKIRNSRLSGGGFDDMPDRFRGDRLSPNLAKAAHSSENGPRLDARDGKPLVYCALRPARDRNGANVFTFADQVGNNPVILADLEILFL